MRLTGRVRRKSLFWRTAGLGVFGCVSLPIAATEQMADIGLDINIDYSNDPFYTQLWFFILVASLFLLLLILLVRGERRSIHKRKARKALRRSTQLEKSMQSEESQETLPSNVVGSLEESIHAEKPVQLEESRLAGNKLKVSEELV